MIKCPQPQAHPDRCECRPVAPDAFEIARHSKRLVEQQRERIAALEAECERFKRAAQTNWNEFAENDHSNAVAELQALKAQMAEPVGYQYQRRDGEWCSFIDQRHYENTVADGTWPIRAIYAAPPAAQDVSALVEALEEAATIAGLYGDSLIDGGLKDDGLQLLAKEREFRDLAEAHRQAQQQDS